jgi:4-hydroxythreonine-4-phosphate dehydrogenase
MSTLGVGTECVRIGYADALVYTPLDHRSLAAAGTNIMEFSDFFAARLGGEGPRMDVLLAGHRRSRVWVGRVAAPMPLTEVPRRITRQMVVEGLVLFNRLMAEAGVADVRIALPSLSSHAPIPGGNCRFETEILAPAVAEAMNLGVNVTGPLAADTVFRSAFSGGYNGILSLYHDQGWIAIKTAAFETAVLLHAGLPVPVVTTAHGSALDIAGKGVASASATIEAIALAAELAMVGLRSQAAGAAESGMTQEREVNSAWRRQGRR